jgi:membrane protease subunit (stomatin/prohibitin family)
MVLGFLGGEFVDVITWLDETRDTMVWRFQRHGNAIKYGAKLTVREGQSAVFVHEGQLADVFGPGMYMLETNNMPIMTTLQHWDHGFDSPFKSEIYFVNTTRFNDQKWGTKNPIIARDPEFGPVRLRAFGSYAMRVADPAKFLTEIVGTDGEFTADEISSQIRNIIVQEASQILAKSGISVLDMAGNTADLGGLVLGAIAPKIAEYGLTIPEFYIENISLPEEVEKALDKRTSMGVVGDLNKFMQFSAATGLAQPNSAAGATLGATMGAALGAGMAAVGPWGAAPAGATAAPPPPPPPLPSSVQWHAAIDGATQGPLSMDDISALIAAGKIGAQTLVWAAGMDGWVAAAQTALAAKLGAVPPPLPPAAPKG